MLLSHQNSNIRDKEKNKIKGFFAQKFSAESTNKLNK